MKQEDKKEAVLRDVLYNISNKAEDGDGLTIKELNRRIEFYNEEIIVKNLVTDFKELGDHFITLNDEDVKEYIEKEITKEMFREIINAVKDICCYNREDAEDD